MHTKYLPNEEFHIGKVIMAQHINGDGIYLQGGEYLVVEQMGTTLYALPTASPYDARRLVVIPQTGPAAWNVEVRGYDRELLTELIEEVRQFKAERGTPAASYNSATYDTLGSILRHLRRTARFLDGLKKQEEEEAQALAEAEKAVSELLNAISAKRKGKRGAKAPASIQEALEGVLTPGVMCATCPGKDTCPTQKKK